MQCAEFMVERVTQCVELMVAVQTLRVNQNEAVTVCCEWRIASELAP
jgi:hypothetical protein